jgi:hypothetical protein
MSQPITRYVVFVTEDEEAWEAKSDAERQEVYDADARFVRLLEQRGGKVVGGAELGPTSTWHTLEHRSGLTRRTAGPYAESVEQLGGFYVVECDDIDTVLDACGKMIGAHVHIQVAPVVG